MGEIRAELNVTSDRTVANFIKADEEARKVDALQQKVMAQGERIRSRMREIDELGSKTARLEKRVTNLAERVGVQTGAQLLLRSIASGENFAIGQIAHVADLALSPGALPMKLVSFATSWITTFMGEWNRFVQENERRKRETLERFHRLEREQSDARRESARREGALLAELERTRTQFEKDVKDMVYDAWAYVS